MHKMNPVAYSRCVHAVTYEHRQWHWNGTFPHCKRMCVNYANFWAESIVEVFPTDCTLMGGKAGVMNHQVLTAIVEIRNWWL